MPTVIIFAGSSALSPGSIVLRRTWPTPSAKMPFAGISLKRSAAGVLHEHAAVFVHRIALRAPSASSTAGKSLPVVCWSVERTTTWPLNGSSWNMKSNAAFSFSSGTFHATSAPSARLLATSVCRTRRIVPAASIARMRSSTVSSGTPLLLGDLDEGLADEALDLVLGNGEDLRVDGVGVFDGNHGTSNALLRAVAQGRCTAFDGH